MKISYIEPIAANRKRVERVFGCSYANYLFPNIYLLIIFALLEKRYEVAYNQKALYFRTDKGLRRFINEDKSDCYLIFSVNLSMEDDIGFAKRILDVDKRKQIIFLGPAPTFFTDRFIIDANTYAVRGEPDLATVDLIEALAGGGDVSAVKGVSYLKCGAVVHNAPRGVIEDLDVLPFPARHIVKKDNFYNPKLGIKPFTAILTSRGCAHKCIYCVPCSLNFARELEYKKMHGSKPPVRVRSADSIIREFVSIRDAGYRAVSIIDDQFIWDKQSALKICAGIKGLKLAWGCLSRADHFDEEIVKAMSESGCGYVDMGVESFVQEILDDIKKEISVERLIYGIRLLKKYKISVKLNILLGASPLETRETLKHTFKMIKELDADQVMFDALNAFPGTELYRIAASNHWLATSDYTPKDVAASSNISYDHLSGAELARIVKKANRDFFLNRKFLKKNIFRLRNPAFMISDIKAALNKLRR